MSLTVSENGELLTETIDGITMPIDTSFKKVNDWIHGMDVQFEEVQGLCLAMASENDQLKVRVAMLEACLENNNRRLRERFEFVLGQCGTDLQVSYEESVRVLNETPKQSQADFVDTILAE